jgi:replicative DNA helicase
MIVEFEEIENIVIGSILIDRNVTDIALTNIIPIDFEIQANHDIFNSVMRLYSNGRPIDMVTVIQDMKANKEHDQLQHILKVTNLVGSTANFEAHVMILKNKSIKRQLSYLGQKLISDATKEEIEAIDQTLSLIENANNILSRIDIKKVITFPELVMKTIDESLSRKDNDKLGLLSGFEKFDNITSGFCAPDYSIFAAGPGE